MIRFIHLSTHSSSFQSNEMCSFNCAFCSFSHNLNRRSLYSLPEACSTIMNKNVQSECFFCSIALCLLFAHVDEVHRCYNWSDLKLFLKWRVRWLQHILFYLIEEQLVDLVAARGKQLLSPAFQSTLPLLKRLQVYLPGNISLRLTFEWTQLFVVYSR